MAIGSAKQSITRGQRWIVNWSQILNYKQKHTENFPKIFAFQWIIIRHVETLQDLK